MADKSGMSRMLSLIQDQAKSVVPDGIRMAKVESGGIVQYDGLKLDSTDYTILGGITLTTDDDVALYKIEGDPEDAADDAYIVIGKVGSGGSGADRVYIRYSANSTGADMHTSPQATDAYIGFAVTASETAPTSYTDYIWSQYKGLKGDTGDPGPANKLSIGTVSSGSAASASMSGESPNQSLNLVLPKGDKGNTGDKGEQGQSNTLSIGTVSTLDAGSSATANITGTSPNQTLSLGIPKGSKGNQGDKGETGSPNTLSIGTVAGGTSADASITGTAPNQTLNLTLPKGDKGDKGNTGDIGPAPTMDSALSSTSTNGIQNKVINSALSNKVDKVAGKGLSENDYTTAEKTKLAGIYKKMYPIGVIFEWCDSGISTGTAPDLSTVAKVQEYFGFGTWEAFGGGKVLVGSGTSDKTFTVGEANKGQSTLTLKAHTHTQATHTHSSCDYQSYNIVTSGSGSKRTGPFGVGTHQGTIGTSEATPTIYANTEIGDPNKGNLPCYEVIYRYRRIA